MAGVRNCLLLAIAYFFNYIYCDVPLTTNNDVQCKLRDVIKPTENNNNFHVPTHVRVLRCLGFNDTWKSQKNYKCVAVASKIVRFDLTNEDGVATRELKMLSHTRCAMKCVRGPCKGGAAPYKPPCESGEIWDVDTNKCRDTNIKHGCAADEEDSDKGVSVTNFIAALVIEFFVVMILFFVIIDVCKYKKSSTGVIYKTREYVRHLSVNAFEDVKMSVLKPYRPSTGSVSFLYDDHNGKMPNGNKVVAV